MKRGWIENSHFESQCFHLKFSLRSKDIVWESLVHYQVVNHFQKSTNITTKLGLLKTLENSMWHCSIDKDDFLAHYFSFVTTLDKLYGTEISLNIIGDICGYIYSIRGVASLSFINKLSISEDDKNHLQLLISNKQIRSLLDVTRYSRVIG